MDGARAQALVFKGYGIAAQKIGTQFYVYRSASMINPLDKSNYLQPAFASFTTGAAYATYNKPNVPFWTVLVDATTLLPGDWLDDGNNTYFIADIQALLPIPAIQCSTRIDISRPSYGTPGGPLEATEDVIATSMPVFMFNKKDKSSAPHWFPANTDSVTALPEWQFYVNTRIEGDIQSKDIITDVQGIKYIIDTCTYSSFGYILTAKLAQP